MSQQYPNQPPSQWPTPQGPQYYPPQPKKSKKWLYIGIGAAVFLVIGIAASSNGSKGTSDSPTASDARPAVTSSKAPAAKKPKTETAQSPAQQFKTYVAKNGTPTEKAAVSHVTKIQGADSENDILDSADIYTNYSGDLMSGDTASGKLLASAFADWQASRGKDSKNGLVTVYNKDGDLLSNGKY